MWPFIIFGAACLAVFWTLFEVRPEGKEKL